MINGTRLLAVLGCAIAVAGWAAGCDDGGSMSNEEYFEQLEELGAGGNARADELAEQSEDLDDFDETRAFAAEVVDVLEGFLNDLDELEPPDEVQVAHGAYRRAVANFAEESRRIGEEFFDRDDAESFGEGAAALRAFDFTAIREACNELQRLADQDEISVDLVCPD